MWARKCNTLIRPVDAFMKARLRWGCETHARWRASESSQPKWHAALLWQHRTPAAAAAPLPHSTAHRSWQLTSSHVTSRHVTSRHVTSVSALVVPQGHRRLALRQCRRVEAIKPLKLTLRDRLPTCIRTHATRMMHAPLVSTYGSPHE